MLALLDCEERAIPEQQYNDAAERRERNARAIAEVVGRNPSKAPAPHCGSTAAYDRQNPSRPKRGLRPTR
jgi:hypothetical protein